MKFDVKITHEGRYVGVRVEGESGAGRLLSLLQLLEVDCRGWAEPAVLWDLREVEMDLSDREQAQVAEAAALAVKRVGKLAMLGVPHTVSEAGGVRVFEEEAAAQAWLGAA